MGRLKICVSDRCFFPQSAFRSSASVVKKAKSLGYQGVEFHPTWVVWLETLFRGELSCDPKYVTSFHYSWREDGKYYLPGPKNWLNRVTLPAYNLFVFEPWGAKTIHRLVEKYAKPVVVHYSEDFKKFKNTLLELNRLSGLNQDRVLEALKKNEAQGVAVDTDKFYGWLKEYHLKRRTVLKNLFPFVKEVHFRFGHREDIDLFSGRIKSESARLMKELVEMGYRGRVVVEMGWPDEGSLKVLKEHGFGETHRKIIKWLNDL